MSGIPDSTLADPHQIIADLRRQLVECRAERDEAVAERLDVQAKLAETTAERDEALGQQTATAEVLQVINSSPGDLTPVFDAMLDKALGLCGAAFGVLWSYNGTHLYAEANRGTSSAYAEVLSSGRYPADATGLTRRFLKGERFVHGDVAAGEGYRLGRTLSRALVDLDGGRTNLAVPLRREDALLGFIVIYRREVRPFSDKQIELLQNFAAQAVIAMENARLLSETHEALEQQTAVAEVLGVINSSPGDLAPVFDAMLERALRLCEASFGILFIRDGERFRGVATRNLPPSLADFVQERFQPSPAGFFEKAARGQAFEHITDLSAEAPRVAGDPRARAFVELGGARTILSAALYKEGEVLGWFGIYRSEVRPFTEKQIALLQNFAAQAVIAMENARLLTETREALEQQTATAEVLQVINSSPGDLAPVFAAMLEKAMRLCGAVHGTLTSYDGEYFRCVANHNLPEPLFELLCKPRRAAPDSPQERLLQGEHIVHIADMRALPWEDNEVARAGAEIGFTRTALYVALRKDNTLIGYIGAQRNEVRPFTDKQIALLQNFAAQAVIAMENARLITETREALDQQTATAEVLGVINASPGDLKPVFDAMLEKAMSLCEAASGVLMTYDGEYLHAASWRGVPAVFYDYLRQPVRPASGNTVYRLLQGEEVVHIADLREDVDNWRGDAARRAMIDLGGARTLVIVPLRKDGKLVGTIRVYRQEVRPFTDKQIALLQNFAAQGVIAMENARLLGELRQRTEEVSELNRSLEARVAEQVDELGRVGRLKRFLAPQLAELIVSRGDEKILESHRREIVVVFCDLRGYTAFTETAEPEEVLDFLREYHGALGPLVAQFEGTLDQFSGDGIMVFFNDPVPCPDPAERAVKMAMAMREAARKLIAAWRRHGSELGFGAGIAQGYATLGQIGFSDRSGYTAIGTVCNLAARLCAEAKDGQILVSSRIAEAVESVAKIEDLGNLELKGLRRPVAAFNVVQSIIPVEARPNLTVVARSSGV